MSKKLFRKAIRQCTQYPKGTIGALDAIGCYLTALAFGYIINLMGFFAILPIIRDIPFLLSVLGLILGLFYGVIALVEYFLNLVKPNKSIDERPGFFVLVMALFSLSLSSFGSIIIFKLIQF